MGDTMTKELLLNFFRLFVFLFCALFSQEGLVLEHSEQPDQIEQLLKSLEKAERDHQNHGAVIVPKSSRGMGYSSPEGKTKAKRRKGNQVKQPNIEKPKAGVLTQGSPSGSQRIGEGIGLEGFLVLLAALFFVVVCIRSLEARFDEGHADASSDEEQSDDELDTSSELVLFEWLSRKYNEGDSVKIYKRIYLINPNYRSIKSAVSPYFNVDVALLCKQGIIVFEVKETHANRIIKGKGTYSQEYFQGPFRASEMYHDDPVAQCNDHIKKLILVIKRKYGIRDVPMKGIVVNFVSGRTRMSVEFDPTAKSDYVYIRSSAIDPSVSSASEERGFQFLGSRIEYFLKQRRTLSNDSYGKLESLLSQASNAPFSAIQKHSLAVRQIRGN